MTGKPGRPLTNYLAPLAIMMPFQFLMLYALTWDGLVTLIHVTP